MRKGVVWLIIGMLVLLGIFVWQGSLDVLDALALIGILILIGLFAGQIAICLKWGRWYILPGLLVLLVIYCVYSYSQADWNGLFGDGNALGWLIYSWIAGALLADSLVATPVGMLMRRRRNRQAAELEALQTEMDSE